MPISQALALGGLIGFLVGCVIILVMNVGVDASLVRIAVLTITGAWMGAMLAWLDHLLHASRDTGKGSEERKAP